MRGLLLTTIFFTLAPAAIAQQPRSSRSEAQKRETDGVITWTLGDNGWDFKDITLAYEPIKGRVEDKPSGVRLAVWQLRLVKNFEEGAAKLHEEMRGSPFRIVLLDAERVVINPDLPAEITPVPTRSGDVIEMYVRLPGEELLADVKTIRILRRTDVGF